MSPEARGTTNTKCTGCLSLAAQAGLPQGFRQAFRQGLQFARRAEGAPGKELTCRERELGCMGRPRAWPLLGVAGDSSGSSGLSLYSSVGTWTETRSPI